MTDPVDPHYPPYENQPPAPPVAPTPLSLFSRLGARVVRRPEPRLGVSLAGAGIALAVLGVLVWSVDFLTGPDDGGGRGGGGQSSHRFLGVALSLVVVVAGYVLAVSQRRGPLATAGVVATALGVPVLVGFLSFDTSPGQSGLPFSLDAVVLVSVLAWLVSYLAVAGTRGHAFYLALAAIAIWEYVVEKAEPDIFSSALFFPVIVSEASPFGSPHGPPDWTTIAVLSFVFGIGYYLAAFGLDRSGRSGAATGFVLAGFFATATGIAAAAANLHAIGTGIVLIVLGVSLAGYGARAGRRFTTWAWSAGVALGVTVIIVKLAGDNNAASGIALILSGAVVVLGAHLLTRVLHEPDDIPHDTRTGVVAGD
jgi:hypothetical protein